MLHKTKLLAVICAVGLAGCAGGAASGMLGMFVALFMSGALLFACSGDGGGTTPTSDTAVSEPLSDATASASDGASVPVISDTWPRTPGPDADLCDGAWEECCVDGVVSTCCCENNADCNYGMFQTCEDGSCVGPAEQCKAKD